MATKVEIKAKYRIQHDTLSSAFYAKKRSKAGVTTAEQAAFDARHKLIWETMKAELIAGGHLTIPTPPRDLAAEIDSLKAEIEILKGG